MPVTRPSSATGSATGRRIFIEVIAGAVTPDSDRFSRALCIFTDSVPLYDQPPCGPMVMSIYVLLFGIYMSMCVFMCVCLTALVPALHAFPDPAFLSFSLFF